ncbi:MULTISPECIES: hypothetical protein [unclassified Arthrobacter]|uniref:hypothetical protein n=1 Tax=unclassified Arthrobacter TaxID=235627 RepID=UPI0015E1FA84|nr:MULTISPECIES: hypothetical protein [unclassified Arthrobacter]
MLGIDVNSRRLQAILGQRADLLEGDRDRSDRALVDPAFDLTCDPPRLSSAAAVVVAVPTPVDTCLVPDLSILSSACRTVVEHAVPRQLLVLASSTYVGSTRALCGPLGNPRVGYRKAPACGVQAGTHQSGRG